MQRPNVCKKSCFYKLYLLFVSKYKYLIWFFKKISYVIIVGIKLIIYIIYKKMSTQNKSTEKFNKIWGKTILLKNENLIKIWKKVYSNKIINMCK